MPNKPPVTLSEEQKRQLPTLGQYLTVEQIADVFRIARSTLFAIFDREPELHGLYKEGAAKAVLKSQQTLVQVAWGWEERDADGKVVKKHPPSLGALCFHLKTKGGLRETDRVEVTGKGGGAIQHEARETFNVDPAKLSPAARKELRALMAAQLAGSSETGEDDGSTAVH